MVSMVEQSVVDAHLQRVHRFVDNVNKFQQKLDTFMSPSERTKQAPAKMAVQTTTQTPVTNKVVTSDEVDIDAILSGIDLSAEMSM